MCTSLLFGADFFIYYFHLVKLSLILNKRLLLKIITYLYKLIISLFFLFVNAENISLKPDRCKNVLAKLYEILLKLKVKLLQRE